jgi:hypothetical protein
MNALKTIESKIKHNRPILKKKFKVKEIGIFGSFARGESVKNSDVDILVEFSRKVGWDYFDLKDFLENIFGRQVDLVTKKALKPYLRDRILKEVIYQ